MTINIRYKQWATQKRKAIAFNTIEIYHPDIGTLRYVNHQQFRKSFRLNADSPRDAGRVVDFQPFSFEITRPNQNGDPILSLEVQMGRVGSQVKSNLKMISATGFMTPAQLIYRVFLDNEQVLSLPFEISTITIEDQTVVIRGEQENPTFRDISRIYLASDFPGLTQTI